MLRPKLIQLVALVLCAALVFGASQLIAPLNAGRKALNMYGSTDVLENAPPEYAFAIQAFGAFRSLIVNMAFIRAESYKEQGRYYDAMQLASWICQLQPRFPSVWEFQSWNMAWNISVTTYTAEERWNWVYNGIKLLRDEGLRYNPRAVNLYKQLAWTFNNKMGETLDDFHWDYKRNWAWRMHLVLGPNPTGLETFQPGEEFKPVAFDATDDPLLETARVIAQQQEERRRERQQREGTPFRTTTPLEERLKGALRETPTEGGLTPAALRKRAAWEYIQSIEEAPKSLTELYQQFPETRDLVAQLREIGVTITDERLDEDSYWYDGRLAQTFFARYRQLVDAPALRDVIAPAAERRGDDPAVVRLGEIPGLREGRPAGQALVRFLQRKVLTEVYKLQPARMLMLIEHFGPLDWRVVDSQSLYWVTEGLIQGDETLSSFQNDKTNTARILFFSLRNLFSRNRLTFEPNRVDIHKSYINFSPDLDFVEPMHRAFITYAPMIDPDPGNASGAGATFRTGHINFLSEAIRMLWFNDRLAEAEHYYEYLRRHYYTRPDGTPEPSYTQALGDFVINSMYSTIAGPRETERLISDLLHAACNELANENFASYNRLVSKALEFHARYMEEKRDFTGPRLRLRRFEDYQVDVFRNWFAVPAINSLVTLHKSRLWRVAPPGLKQRVYDDLSEWFRRECQAWNFDVAKAFPEPAGMDAFRKTHPAREVERQESNIETPPEP